MKTKKLPIVVISGPDGIGKNAVISKMIEINKNFYKEPLSFTTREKRAGEQDGVDYYFVGEPTFLRLMEEGIIFEHTLLYGTYRGMSKSEFDEILNKNMVPLKECDLVGLQALKSTFKDHDIISFFITAPKKVLIERLNKRGGNQRDIDARILAYDYRVKEAMYYDHVVENIDLTKAAKKINQLIKNRIDGKK